MARKSREIPSVNASSMADIAFLLLTFFLVATDINKDTGIEARLPEWNEDPVVQQKEPRNVLEISINAQGQVLVEGTDFYKVKQIKDLAITSVVNPSNDPRYAANTEQAVISLQHDRATSYAIYLEVYDQLFEARTEVWDSFSQKLFNKPFAELTEDQQTKVKDKVPFIISEAEPTEFGQE